MSSMDEDGATGGWKVIVPSPERTSYESKVQKLCSEYHQIIADRQREERSKLTERFGGEDFKEQRGYAKKFQNLQSDLEQFEVSAPLP